MNQVTNRQVICETLLKAAETQMDIVVLCSDCLLYTSRCV